MIGGTKNQTPNVACTTDSTQNRVQVATADANIKWKDIVITKDNASATPVWVSIYASTGTLIQNTTSGQYAGTAEVTAGDYLLLSSATTGNVKVTLRYTPTNSLLGSWTINV
jgi:hypothetical protein